MSGLAISSSGSKDIARSQANWYIDPVSGVDTNSGITSGTAIKTHAEFVRRVGAGPLTPTGGTCTVNIIGDIPTNDPVKVAFEMGAGASIRYRGGVKTTNRTGTFTAATPYVVATNTPNAVTDSNQAGQWTADISRRVRITKAATAYAWVAKDLTTKQARISAVFADNGYAAVNGTTYNPAVADAYAVETLYKIPVADIQLRGDQSTAFSSMSFEDLDVIATNTFLLAIQSYGCSLIFYRSRLEPIVNTLSGGNGANTYFINCLFESDLLSLGVDTVIAGCIKGGLSLGTVALTNSDLKFESHTIIQGTSLSANPFGLITNTGGVGIFDSAVTQFGPGGDAVYVAPRGALRTAGSLWGSGNAGFGVNVAPGAMGAYSTAPTVTGTGGDLKLGGSTSQRVFDPAAGTYTAARNTTWTNLAAAIGSGGFAGNAINVSNHALFVSE